MRWLLAVLHLLGLGIGLGAIWARSRSLRGTLDVQGVRRVLAADTWWGIAALLWISTGLLRAFAGFEKGSAYYLQNHLFLGKLGLLLLILALEIGPILTFIGWRKSLAGGGMPDTAKAPRYATTSSVQVVLVILMVIAATGMARGYGMR
jgi:putative membrane protein